MEEVAIITDSKGEGYDFAKGIFNYIKERESRKFPISLIDIKKSVFKDGEFKIKICNNIRRKKCFLIYDSNKQPSDWMTELLFTLQAMTSSSPSEINVILPYTKFARQERKDESRISVNAKVLADTISLYANLGMTVDLHAPQIQEYFEIPFDNLYSFPVLVNHLQKYHNEILDNLVLVSPDLGGAKRVEALAKRLAKKGINVGIAFGHKTREKDNEVAKITIIGDVSEKNCIIVDDIIDTGNTIVRTGEKLKQKGARKIYAYGTHALFTEGVDKFKEFDKVMISDTMKIADFSNLEIVSLVELFGEAIYRTVIGESLSTLFN